MAHRQHQAHPVWRKDWWLMPQGVLVFAWDRGFRAKLPIPDTRMMGTGISQCKNCLGS